MKKALKIFFTTTLITAAVLLIAVTVTVAIVKGDNQYVNFDVSRLNAINYTLTVKDFYGNDIDQPVYINNRKQVSIDALNDYTIDAFVYTEDKRFFSHDGLDYVRIGKAMVNNLMSARFKEGASTISQQLIKNTHLDNEKTIKRKINEMLLTGELESRFSKREILEMYLNTIYFGKNAYGIESASNVYFDKSASELTLSESAILAGMIKAPNTYAPDKNITKCTERRNTVLALMKQNNRIDETQYNDAINEEITVTSNFKLQQTYMYAVVEEACQLLNLSPLQLLNSGLVIETYFKPQIQKEVTTALEEYNGDENVSALIAENDNCGIVAFYGTGGDIYFSKRQAGSALKPLAVYAPALNERKITVATPVLDEKTTFGSYCPKNFGDKYYGNTNVMYSVTKSLNVPAVKILNSIGVNTSCRYLEQLGMNIEKEQNLSLALGNVTGGTNPLEVIEGYTALARGGLKSDLSFIKTIRNGQHTLYSHQLTRERVFSTASSYLTTNMLQSVVKEGTAKKLATLPYEICAKTGTVGGTNGNSDALVCGYSTKFTFNVWMSGKLDNTVTGGNKPCELASKFLPKIYKGEVKNFTVPADVVRLEIDSKLLSETGLTKLATPLTNAKDRQTFYFDKTNRPTQYSTRVEDTIPLNVVVDGKIVTITADSNLKMRLYKEHDGKVTTADFVRQYVDYNAEEGENTYYAEILLDGQVVGKTSSCSITIPKKEEERRREPISWKDLLSWWD